MKSFRLLSLSAVIIALVSCIDELDKDEPFGQGYSVSSVSVTDQEGADTKSILVIDPQEVSNLQVFAFDPSSGNILYYGEGAGAALKGKPVTAYVEGVSTFEWCLPVGVPLDIYAVANIGQIDVPSSVSQLLASDAMDFTFDSLEDLNDMDGVPMSGVLEDAVDDGSGNTLTIKMKKVLARFDIGVSFDGLPGSPKIHRITVNNAHRHVTLFGSNEAAASEDDLTGEMDYTSEADVNTLNSGGRITLYLPENMQTAVNGATTTDKLTGGWRDIQYSSEYRHNMEYCTYMDFSYTYEKFGEGTQNKTTRLYLGGDPTKNFDVRRNVSTSINVKLGDGDNDVFRFMTPNGEFVKEGESLTLTFEYMSEIEGLVEASCFSTENPLLSVTSVTVDPRQLPDDPYTGSIVVSASDAFEEDSQVMVYFTSPKAEYSGSSQVIKVDVDEIPTRVYFEEESMRYGYDSFLVNHVFAEFADGSVMDITDHPYTQFSSDNPAIAYYSRPEAVTVDHEFKLPVLNKPSEFYSDCGIYFGSTKGTTNVRASYLGVEGVCSVTAEPRRLWFFVDKTEVNLGYGESVDIRFYLEPNYYLPYYNWSTQVVTHAGVEYPLVGFTSLGASDHCTMSISFDDSHGFLDDNCPSGKVTVTAGNVAENFTFSIGMRNAKPMLNAVTGTETYGYGESSKIIRVKVWPTDGEYGTLQSIRIDGPDKLVAGTDVAVYSAYGTFKDSEGNVTEHQLCKKGEWTSNVFADHHALGIFQIASTGSVSNRTRNGYVRFCYNGVTVDKPVFVFYSSRFEVCFRDLGKYWAKKIWNSYENKRIYAQVYEPYVVERYLDVDGNVIHSVERTDAAWVIDGKACYDACFTVEMNEDGDLYTKGLSRIVFNCNQSGSYLWNGSQYTATSLNRYTYVTTAYPSGISTLSFIWNPVD